jgi:Spy/CpxP family protein refolding chaperone
MREKLIIFLLVFSLTVNVAVLVTMGYFWGKYDGEGKSFLRGDEFPPPPPPPLISELSLDKEQRGKMRTVRRSFINEIAPIRSELTTRRESLVNLLTAKKPDRNTIDQKLSEINALQSKIQYAVINNLLREKDFLNPKQQEQYFNCICNKLCPDCLRMGKGRRGPGMPGMGRGRGKGRGNGMGYESRRDKRGMIERQKGQ